MLKIVTLGGLSITLDEKLVEGFVSRKAEALLVYLAAHPREHPRESLADLLWDDLPQKLSLSYLRTALSSLQKQLAPYLQVTRHSIAINPESDYWIDITELNGALDTADTHWEQRAAFSHATASALEQALKLYHGEFLQGFYARNGRQFEDWMLMEQERLRNRVQEAYYRLGNHYFERNMLKAAAAHTAQALKMDPLWEEAHRQMMLILAHSGQRSAAIAQYETCCERLKEELDIEPEEQTTAIYKAIVAGKISAIDMRRSTIALPIVGAPFIDRPDELREIAAKLDRPECRLLTLIGPGGVGKTRLALEYARQVYDDYRDGVSFVSYTGVHEPGRILETIASVLGVDFTGDFSSEANLVRYLREREIMLVLDNFENMVPNAEVLSNLLQKAPSLKILVTSRERLNLLEEWLFTVETLPVPEQVTPQTAEQLAAIQLFAQCAQRVQPQFSLAKELPAVVRICRILGGIPLAIELAASWVRVLPCEQIAQEVQNSLDFLSTSLRNFPERHRSMRAVFESSWNLLNEEEQRALRQLSIFRHGFDKEAAVYVTGASVFTLSSLVDKSLTRSVNDRCELHELLRQFAREKLDAHPEEARQARQRHSDYYAAYLSASEDKLARTLPDSKFDEVIRDIENIRLAWQFAVEHGNVENIARMLRPLFQLYDAQSNYRDIEGMFGEAVDKLKAMPDENIALPLARTQAYQGACNFRMDRYETAERLLKAALPVLQAHDAAFELRHGLLMLGRCAAARGRYAEAKDSFSGAAEMMRAAGDFGGLAHALFRLASSATMLGEYDRAEAYMAQGLGVMSESDKTAKMFSLIVRGDLDVRRGRFEEAQAVFEEALALSTEMQSRSNHAMILADLAQALIALGQHDRAKTLCSQSFDQNHELQNQWGQAYALLYLGRAYDETGQHTQAQECFRQGIQICEASGIQTTLILLLRQSARIHTYQHDFATAGQLLQRALKISLASEIPALTLDVLTGFAGVSAIQQENADAAAIAACVAAHPAATFETRAEAERILAELGQPLPTDGEVPALDLIIARCLDRMYAEHQQD